MTSSRVRANNRRREREHREEAREALSARTTHLVDATGRPVHMVGWTPQQIADWKKREGVV